MEMVDSVTGGREILCDLPASTDDLLDMTRFPENCVFLGLTVGVSGERLKKARKSAGLTQAELGKRLGVTGATVSNWEKENTEPKAKVLGDIAALLDVPVVHLLDELTYALVEK